MTLRRLADVLEALEPGDLVSYRGRTLVRLAPEHDAPCAMFLDTVDGRMEDVEVLASLMVTGGRRRKLQRRGGGIALSAAWHPPRRQRLSRVAQ